MKPGRLKCGRQGSVSDSHRQSLNRSLQRNLIATLDRMLPPKARCCRSANGAGTRAIGLHGRSTHDVLRDCIGHIQKLKLLAASDIVDLRNRKRTEEDPRLQQAGEITSIPSFRACFRASAASSQVSNHIPFFPEDFVPDKQVCIRNTLNDPFAEDFVHMRSTAEAVDLSFPRCGVTRWVTDGLVRALLPDIE